MESWYASEPRAAEGRGGIPQLAAAGSLDEVIPPENSRLLASGPEDWHARFPGGGHAFMAQEPLPLAKLIAAFLGAFGG